MWIGGRPIIFRPIMAHGHKLSCCCPDRSLQNRNRRATAPPSLSVSFQLCPAPRNKESKATSSSPLYLLPTSSHGTYLYANEDGRSVSLHPNRDSLSAAWIVHLLFRKSCSYGLLLLHSAAYGRYLAATGTPASRDHRVGLLDFDDMNDFDIRWLGIASASKNDELLLHHLYCRGNLCVRRPRQWFKNSAAALHVQSWDNHSRTTPEMLWVVEDIPPNLPFPPQRQSQLSRVLSGSAIRTVRISIHNNDEWRSLLFMGNSLLNLKDKILGLVGAGYTLYVRAGMYGRLTQLLVDLPTTNESVDLVLLPSETEIDNVRATSFTPFGQIEWGGVGLSVGNVFGSQNASNTWKSWSNPIATKEVWLVGNSEEASQVIQQWRLSGKPKDTAVTVAANITFSDMMNIKRTFQLSNASHLLESMDDYTLWICKYRVLASISQLPHPPEEVASHFTSAIHNSVIHKNNEVLQPWILVDLMPAVNNS